MSMLNDALKRASQTDRSRARPAQPRAATKPAAYRRGQSLALALAAGSVFALGLAVWFFWQLRSTKPSPEPALITIVTPKVAPVIHTQIQPPSALIVASPQAPQVVKATTPEVVPAPAPAPAKPAEPSWAIGLKLSGIFFRQTNPLALINGKTVGVGDDIDGIRVTKIESDRVTVEWDGKTKELTVKDDL